ncbi:DUF4382 domain-containing protein [Laspinema olomoucense]|uniref:DUF4382 domain-containing protein n=1 Tax=Laspinema olomoucense TaxID=3231600 RepID=UPI0021BB5115|nr:DUF4382 domain-containing protein [Laspinema sp. D3a]MCT7988352.1 DUF4382 domain-containing protein [Laspinema sp. D3a]
MKKNLIILTLLAGVVPTLLLGCEQDSTPLTSTPEPVAVESAPPPTPGTETASGETGTLQIVANGEDFVRDGFTSKDGWKINFNHVYVNLAEVTAYQTDPPYNPESGSQLTAKQQVQLDGVKTVDLTATPENPSPVVAEVPAPAGQYNALSWKMVKGTEGPGAGYSLVMDGTAEKDGQTLPFVLKLDREMAFTCGEFVGDQRKGMVSPGSKGQLEATFHFDHLFGDAGAPADDELNVNALGFEPIAALASGDQVNLTRTELQQALSTADYQTLENLLPSLGHVGEGHCQESTSS